MLCDPVRRRSLAFPTIGRKSFDFMLLTGIKESDPVASRNALAAQLPRTAVSLLDRCGMARGEQRRPCQIAIGPFHPEQTRRGLGDFAPGLCGNPVAELLG